MKKIISFFIILSLLFFYRDIELFYKGGCYIIYNSPYLDGLYCKNDVLTNGGYIDHFYYKDKLFIIYINILYEYPRVCYLDEIKVCIYNYKEHRWINLSKNDFIKEYGEDFYKFNELPENYIKNYAGNCLP